ncbi:hypothetical protein CBR_g50666, partial [Chara braunii]
KTVGGATPLAPTKHVEENKWDHNKGEATDVDSAQVGGSGEDIEGSMRCGRQVGKNSEGRHIGGREYRERHVEQQGRQASLTECEDQQLEQNEPNTEEDELEDENNRDNDDFGERESNEDEDDDNEEIREDDDENDAHCRNKKAMDVTRTSMQQRFCVREEEVSRRQTNVGARLVQERNTIRDITQHAKSEEVKTVRTNTEPWRTNLVEMHREASKRKLQMEETEKGDNDIDIRRREEFSKYTPKLKMVRRKTVGGATPLAPTKHVAENKRDHNKGEATDVDSVQVGGSGEDIEGSMRCGRQAGKNSGGRHIGGREYRERHVEQQGRQASSRECEDQQLEQNEPNTEEDESEDENNRDSDDFGERVSNEDEDDDNEEIREDDDENDAHCRNKKAMVMREREKRVVSEKSKVNNRISDNIHTLYAHSKIVKQLMRCVAKAFCLSGTKDAEMYPSVDTYVDAFMGLTESLDPDTQFIVDRSMKSTTPTIFRTQGSRELTKIREEIAYDIVKAFGSVAGLPYPCGTVRDRFEK